MPTKPSAILFDWDNTLVDTWPIIHDALNTTLEAFGLDPWSMEDTRVRVRKSLRDSFPDLFGERWRDAEKVFYKRYGDIHAEKLQPIPGAGETLAALAAGGFYLGVVSNKKGEFLRIEAARLGWDRFFGALVGALDAARDKPATEPVDMALRQSGIERGPRVWIAGDADIDLECAQKAGCTPILIREEAPRPGEFDGHPPARHFQGCVELCKFIQNL